jgi:hypothetical protein
VSLRRLSSTIAFAAAALALATCAAVVVVARVLPGGHPPLSHYVGAIGVPLAWLLALLGLASAVASRASVSRSRYVLTLAGNLTALAGGIGIWLFWPFIAV